MSPILSTPVTIREAIAADLDSLVLLIDMLNVSEGNKVNCNRAVLKELFFGQDTRVQLYVSVAVQEEVPIAFAYYYWGYDLLSESYGFHLSDFAVHADYRRMGIGTRLLSYVGEKCLQAGGKWMSLTSARNNRAAQGFYGSAGLQKIDVDFFAMGPSAIRALIDAAQAQVVPE